MSSSTLTLVDDGARRVDCSLSTVGFLIRHAGVATVRGRFSSVDTGDGIRDSRLRTEFFGAERFPAMTFRSECAVPAPKGRWLLAGELTIRAVARPVGGAGAPAGPRLRAQSRRPALADIIGACRRWTVAMISSGSMPCR